VKEHPFFSDDDGFRIKFERFELNLITGEGKMTPLITDMSCEFPVINQDFMCHKSRYTWISYMWTKLPDDQVGRENLYFEGFIKYDL